MQIGTGLSISEKYIGVIGHDFGYSKKYLLLYSRLVKKSSRVLNDGNHLGRFLQTALTPEYPHLFYALEFPYKHTGIPMSDYEFFLF